MSKKYSRDELLKAVYSGLDSKSAEKKFNIPSSTIRRHRLYADLRPQIGRPSYLTIDQELYFVSMLQLLPDYGFPVTREVALRLIKDYCMSLELKHSPGDKWLRLFMQKHSNDIKWMKEQKMEINRARSFTEDVRSGWFSLVKNVMLRFNLFDKPHQIFNIDETGFCDKTKGEWVIVNSNRRHVFELDGGSGRNYHTVLVAINAGGLVLPPFVIYAGKNLFDSWCCGGPPATAYGVTEKGWINHEMFVFWLKNIFIPATAHLNRPLLLIMDGHTSHISLEIIHLLKSNAIICLILPPHTSHGLQPLDLVLFNSVKNDWCKIIKNYFKEGNKSLKKPDFPRLLKKLFVDKASFSSSRIVSSFARSGIWPFNEHAMKEKVVRTKDIDSILTTNEAVTIPSNILISPPHSIGTISVSSSSITPNGSTSRQDDFDGLSGINTSIAVSTDQALTSDGCVPVTTDTTSYAELRSCRISLEGQLSSSTEKSSNEPVSSITDVQPNSIDMQTCDESHPTPIAAVRNVIIRVLSDQNLQPSPVTPVNNRPRGSRLKNKFGLNITEDEFVSMKLNEQKKNCRRQHRRLPANQTTRSSITKRTTDYRNRSSTGDNSAVEGRNSNDPQTHAAIEQLRKTIELTQSIFDDDSSDEENIFSALSE